ncbi:MAG: HD-GYP domain-containing protein [Clostridiales bacterium]|nr:HD-GYP domain-containing protein [Clostridiales bacterium]
MRRIPLDHLQEGMKLGRTIYTEDGSILMREGTELNKDVGKKLRKYGYESIYVTDALSSESFDDMISSKLRVMSVKEVKNVFQSFDTYQRRINSISSTNLNVNKKIAYEASGKMSKLATDIVSDLMNKKHNEINMVDIKNSKGYLYQHSVNVAVLSIVFGMKLGLTQKKLQALAVGSLLHDIGFNFIDYDQIKGHAEDDIEIFDLVKDHPEKGYEYLKDNVDISAHVKQIVLQHHEWCNGEGYPYGLKSNEIAELSKIVAICDVYDNLTSDHLYRAAYEPQEAQEHMMVESVKRLDADLVKQFIKITIPYPVGTVVSLTNGELGVVEDVNLDYPLRPKVKVVKQVVGRVELYTRDLMEEHHLLINKVEYEIPEEYLN